MANVSQLPRKMDPEEYDVVILGSGCFIGPKTVEVTLQNGTVRQLRGANVIVNTGTRAALEPVPGLLQRKNSARSSNGPMEASAPRELSRMGQFS